MIASQLRAPISAFFAALLVTLTLVDAKAKDNHLHQLDCTQNQIAKFDGTQWVCAADENTMDTNAATKCAANEVLLGGDGGCIPIAELVALASPKTFFVSSQTFTGDLVAEAQTNFGTECDSITGGLDAGDCICQALADLEGLTGTYRAWLGDASGSPSTRFTRSLGPYVLVNSVEIASDYDGLAAGSLSGPPNVTELGTTLGNEHAWTGVLGDEPLGLNCNGWTNDGSQQGGGIIGAVGQTGLGWTRVGFSTCEKRERLYCAQQ